MAFCLRMFKRRRNANRVDQLGLGGSSISLPVISVSPPPAQPMFIDIIVHESSSENRPSSLPVTGDPVPPPEPTPTDTVARDVDAESHVSSSQGVPATAPVPPVQLTPMTTMAHGSHAQNRDLSLQAVQGSSGSGSYFSGARDFTVNNPTFVQIHGEDKSHEEDKIHREDQIRRMMKILLKYVMDGASSNDASRKYRPSCHPGTREAILKLLLAWFKDPFRAESIFHLTGPAGVGKSAIMQTYTEMADHRVISVFISRPNKCNDPNRVFTTTGYRFASCIEAYRDYIVDQIAADPSILNTDMETQFRVFIIEPFVVRKVGAGGPPSAVLLDGLDELEGAGAQQNVIRLIGTFMQEYPDAPLAWIIASRPEFHITNTFKNKPLQGRFKSYTISIDSQDSRRDVARFLSEGFDKIRRDFVGLIPQNWPEETKSTKLILASSGLFIFAATALRFVADFDDPDPVSRLDLVLSVIDRSKGVPSEEQPFKNLDNLYTEILSRIPARVLPTTKRLLALALAFRSNDDFLGLRASSKSRTLRGMALILRLDPEKVQPALIKCISTLKLPRREEAHKEPLTFLHASFADYLVDAQRSGEFYIDIGSIEGDVLLGYLDLWDRYSGGSSAGGAEFISAGMPELPEEIVAFTGGLLEEMGEVLLTEIADSHKPQRWLSSQSHQKDIAYFDALLNINMIRLCNLKDGLWTSTIGPGIVFLFVKRTFRAWKEFPDELGKRGMFREVYYKDIDIDLKNNGIYMVKVPDYRRHYYRYYRGHFSVIGRKTKRFLQNSPNLQVLICGRVPGGQVAIFAGDNEQSHKKYCIVPYHPRNA